MQKVKIHPLILVSLLINAAAMALYAYRNFRADETAYGVVFVLLCLFILGLVLYGLVRNRRIGGNGTHES